MISAAFSLNFVLYSVLINGINFGDGKLLLLLIFFFVVVVAPCSMNAAAAKKCLHPPCLSIPSFYLSKREGNSKTATN